MATQFEFRLLDGDAPEGELEADHLIAIAVSLKEVATRLSRAETDAEAVGRPSARTQRVAKLTIGLAPGSTRVLVRRAENDEALSFDLDEERSFDEKFQALVECIALDERPEWVTDTVAIAAGDLRTALEKAAPRVEFKVADRISTEFSTAKTHRDTWKPTPPTPLLKSVTFVGRLRAVDLDTDKLHVTDDLGNKVALPNLVDAHRLGSLLNAYVTVIGVPERDARGKLVRIQDPRIDPADTMPAAAGVRKAVSLDDILASAVGPEPGGLPGLSDEEANAFLQAIGR